MTAAQKDGGPGLARFDLLGKEIKPPREPVPSFYCYHCAATYSQKCKKCGERYCGNALNHCGRDPHECRAAARTEQPG